jgi:hypothetical protein
MMILVFFAANIKYFAVNYVLKVCRHNLFFKQFLRTMCNNMCTFTVNGFRSSSAYADEKIYGLPVMSSMFFKWYPQSCWKSIFRRVNWIETNGVVPTTPFE